MFQVQAMTRVRLILQFTGGDDPALWKTEFHHPLLAPGGRRTARGKDEGAHKVSGTFQWSAGVKVLAAYLLRCAAWARRGLDSAPDQECPCLQGERGSPAATLNDALSKKAAWICDIFGCDAQGRPNLLDLILRSNPDLKRKGEPVVLRLDHRAMPPQEIEVVVGNRKLEDPDAIERQAEAIEGTCKPKELSRSGGVLVIRGTLLEDWTPERQASLERRLQELGIENCTIIKVEEGSIKLTLQLPPEEAERLYWAVQSGELEDLNVIDFNFIRLPAHTAQSGELEDPNVVVFDQIRFSAQKAAVWKRSALLTGIIAAALLLALVGLWERETGPRPQSVRRPASTRPSPEEVGSRPQPPPEDTREVGRPSPEILPGRGAELAPDEPPDPVVLGIHGGEGDLPPTLPKEEAAKYEAKLTEALKAGHQILTAGGTSTSAVEAAIKVLEDSGLFDAGTGSMFNHYGQIELDASIMEGKHKKAGAVAGVSIVKNPITAARAVMEKSRHVLLIGRGAEQFSIKQGLNIVPPDHFWNSRGWEELQKAWKDPRRCSEGSGDSPARRRHYGTVGAVALDNHGNLAAGTSTGGLTDKLSGRVGDSPIIGAGTYADNDTCAVSCTGIGEYFIRYAVAHDIAARVKYKKIPAGQAAREVVEALKQVPVPAEDASPGIKGVEGGVIVLDRKGNFTACYNAAQMSRATITRSGEVKVRVTESPPRGAAASQPHPLDPLSAAEMDRAADILRHKLPNGHKLPEGSSGHWGHQSRRAKEGSDHDPESAIQGGSECEDPRCVRQGVAADSVTGRLLGEADGTSSDSPREERRCRDRADGDPLPTAYRTTVSTKSPPDATLAPQHCSSARLLPLPQRSTGSADAPTSPCKSPARAR